LNAENESEEYTDSSDEPEEDRRYEEGLKADQTAYVQGYADEGAGVAPQNPPFHGKTFTYLS